LFAQITMNLKGYLKKAERENWAVGHFNISNLETLRAIILAARKLKSPVIIGTSEGESKFIGLDQAAALVGSFRKETGLPVFLNLDHGHSLDYIKKAVEAGYDAVHFDGSKLPLSENIKMAKKVVAYARKKKVLVEGEVGFIKGSSTLLEEEIKISKEDLTDPREAGIFIKETNVDSLAVNVGTFHGIRASGINPRINLGRLREIKEMVKGVPLVLHGGSGTPLRDIKSALKLGVSNIHINTELRLAYTNSLRKAVSGKEIVPYKYMPEVIRNIQKVVEKKIKLFGSRNRI